MLRLDACVLSAKKYGTTTKMEDSDEQLGLAERQNLVDMTNHPFVPGERQLRLCMLFP